MAGTSYTVVVGAHRVVGFAAAPLREVERLLLSLMGATADITSAEMRARDENARRIVRCRCGSGLAGVERDGGRAFRCSVCRCCPDCAGLGGGEIMVRPRGFGRPYDIASTVCEVCDGSGMLSREELEEREAAELEEELAQLAEGVGGAGA